MRHVLLALPLLLIAQASWADGPTSQSATQTTAEHRYTLSIPKCTQDYSPDSCSGEGMLSIASLDDSKSVQKLPISGARIKKSAEGKPVGEGYILEDYNFDGHADLSLQTCVNCGSYGGPVYDVYLYDADTSKFMLSSELTQIAAPPNLGWLGVDKKQKLVTTSEKDGCCWHHDSKYRVENNIPVLVEEEFREVDPATPSKLQVTTKKLVNGNWTEKRHTETAR